ncbi:hypothetical protein RRG08_033604 [Elysia crispata]|uniref:Uncharacterized protein n=1 Tax=Elysia crispata TaxID=231223 RepID=A0AAE1CL16_9GAST|nr:hypothetical protein RRG08_033604 [Elysia crispata]
MIAPLNESLLYCGNQDGHRCLRFSGSFDLLRKPAGNILTGFLTIEGFLSDDLLRFCIEENLINLYVYKQASPWVMSLYMGPEIFYLESEISNVNGSRIKHSFRRFESALLWMSH